MMSPRERERERERETIKPGDISRTLMLDIERARTWDEALDDIANKAYAAHEHVGETSKMLPEGYVAVITVAEEVELREVGLDGETRKVTEFKAHAWHSEPGYYYFHFSGSKNEPTAYDLTLHYQPILGVTVSREEPL